MMRRAALFTVLFVGLVLAVGCRRGNDANAANADTDTNTNSATNSPARGNRTDGLVAVIDFNEIVTGVGKQEEVERRLEQLAERYNEQIRVLQERRRELAEELEGQPVEENREKFQEFREIEARLQNLQLQGRREINALRQQLYNDFGQQVRPIARRVARNRGMSVILSSAAVFDYVDAVDITDDVLDEIFELMKQGAFRPDVPETTTDPMGE